MKSMGIYTALCVATLVACGSAMGDQVRLSSSNNSTEETQTVEYVARLDVIHEHRVSFAADHGVAAPAALVAAVKYCPLAELLISMAIEESLGDPDAIGLSGEKGAWQVMDSYWGDVPEDIHGQADQAERILRALLISAKGNKKEALARYNGGNAPPDRSYRYAERILKRAGLLQLATNFLPPDRITFLPI